MRKLELLLAVLLLFAPPCLFAQITTGSISGTVKLSDGKTLSGAVIQATHQPTGTVYSTAAGTNGRYTLPNLRVGGPYVVTVKFVGMEEQSFKDLYVSLGTPLVINATLNDKANTLTGVEVSARSNRSLISSQRVGTATYISPKLLQSTPTITRSVQDFARLTPQVKVGSAAGTGNAAGISFGGQSNRYNQFSIDGANGNDGFGLSSVGTNGAQTNINPISVEAVQEMQIVMSPYDVSQGGFTGGGINAVTKSGTNDFHGAVYGQYQNQNFVGQNAKYDPSITRKGYDKFNNSTYGVGIGGPIIKNKLFFYGNYERYKKSTPLPYDPTVQGSGSNVNVSTLESIRQYLISKWGYDPGDYGSINSENQSTSAFGRIDWNINNKHKLVVRFNHIDGTNDNISRGVSSSVFSNGGFVYRNKTNSAVVELNSSFSSRSSNVFRVTYSAIRDNHGSKSPFPTVTIYQTNADNQANIVYNIGTNNSYHANGLKQDFYTLTDNFTLYRDKHTLTFGTSNEIFKSENIFLQNFFGNYTYGSSSTYTSPNVNNFINNTGLTQYSVGYSTSTDKSDKAVAALKAAQFSVYAQDLWAVNDHFKLTYGVRVDLPVIFTKAPENAAFNTAFAASDVKTNQMPKTQPLFSPRVGFNWDVNGNATTQLRGGAGIFTGRVPFVWISNQLSNTGVATLAYQASNAAAVTAAGIKFNYNPNDAHMGAYVPASGTPVATAINVVDKKFKYPQVFRANLAVDQKLNFWGLIGTLEGVYTKTLNNAYVQNLNISENGEGTVTLGPTTRPLWTKRTNTAFTDVLKLSNTNKGYAYNVTAQIQKPFSKGWSGSIAYTYGHSVSLSDMPSSVAASNWRGSLTTNGLNKLDVGNSNYDMGSRIVGYLSKEFKYAKGHMSTNFTLIYTGQSGQRMSFLYGSNILGDDPSSSNAATATVYIPKTEAEANFVDITNGATAAQQWTNFQTFLVNNSYLYQHQGQVTKRNEARLPFEHHFDFRIAQDFLFKSHKLQIFFDVINIGNLLNMDWGRTYTTSTTGDGLYTSSKNLFLVATGTQKRNGATVTTTAANPGLQFNINSFSKINGVYKAYDVADFTSRWNSQVGVRYSF